MYEELDELYRQLLHVGFFAIQEAVAVNDMKWIAAEVDLLHNIPSLIGESNKLRHEFFWEQERGSYIEWVRMSGNEMLTNRMTTFYEPIWLQMEQVIVPS